MDLLFKKVVVVCLLMGSYAVAETAPATKITGKPRLVRSNPRTEVFFTDLNTSYWIESGRSHNLFQRAFTEAARRNQPVSFTVDTDTRKVIGVEGVFIEPLAPNILSPEGEESAVKGQK